ncbi:Preprotein translocase secY subunit [Mycoplasmopsis meleagridis]|uniref:Protein translocase subunit SecY n=1 Tax=Mycoplasmopsis meleagridis ATCC 25294 TaxID=1264554 RepID=A0A0F5H1B0_9BACT|nr:preprotein translocase subunit SecY [Mycoplasmopsis meleagridis]KKB27069.1 Preprotein translocase secY subunit [Mycoplasmopsis meleagridis ATCC 25294]OAD18327.1 Preprotein translocase secY subunit [Mycoplasmopsis meleagridis]VEU77371.1 preprotein translocase subunit SecY [Mycoplasmopsis meleagridis]
MKNFWQSFSYGFSNLFSKLNNRWVDFWSNKDLLKKIFFTLFLLTIYILATTIQAPFVRIRNSNLINEDAFLNTLNLVGGGGLRNFSLVALGISPFINASLIMSLLQTRAVPVLYKLSQSGPQGRRKINVITRILTLVIAYPQAVLLTQSLGAGNNPFIQFIPLNNDSNLQNLTVYFLLPIILISASLFSLFLAEEITNKGIGNGTSLIIFVGISFQLPAQFGGAFNFFIGSDETASRLVGVIKFMIYLFVYLLVVFIIAFIYNSERHIPIQQIGAGRSKNINEMGKLPIKLNPGGIMPIIFASLLISFPLMIARILPEDSLAKIWMTYNLQFTKPLGLTLLVVITFLFSFLIGLQQSKVDKIAEDFAKNSTFIPGLKPGEQTEDYLIGVVMRLAIFSGFYLVIMAAMQYVMIIAFDLPPVISFGGTGLMILVTVSLETIQQFQARLKSQILSKQKTLSKMNAEFLKSKKNTVISLDDYAKKSQKKKDNKSNKNGDGLLW